MSADNQPNSTDQKNQETENPCLTGKSFEDVLSYLLSGEADDLSAELANKTGK